MPLPDLIEIVPLDKPVRAEITVPGSKSITNRALILAALADGEVTLTGALWSEDTQVMTEALKTLGFEIKVANDPDEFCNRTITVKGLGGKIPNTGTAEKPLELFVGNAGTAARFLSAFVCLGAGVYRLSGVPRMHERPQAALFSALRELGYRVESENRNDKLPVKIFGVEVGSARCADRTPQRGVPTKSCKVSIEESSQFASALLLASKIGGWEIEVVGENAEESPYVAMTSKMIDEFPHKGGKFPIEPDVSGGSYFVASNWLVMNYEIRDFARLNRGPQASVAEFYSEEGWPLLRESHIRVLDWPQSFWQFDAHFPEFLPLPDEISRSFQLADSIMTAIVIAADELGGRGKSGLSRLICFTDLGRLRVQECERVYSLRTELTKCGANVEEKGDTLTVWPSPLHGAEIETYNDHRMAMCFAILGLKVPGIKIKNPACVKKTFPNFFQKLAAQPPHGLGAEIWEIKGGQRTRKLSGQDLFAD